MKNTYEAPAFTIVGSIAGVTGGNGIEGCTDVWNPAGTPGPFIFSPSAC